MRENKENFDFWKNMAEYFLVYVFFLESRILKNLFIEFNDYSLKIYSFWLRNIVKVKVNFVK